MGAEKKPSTQTGLELDIAETANVQPLGYAEAVMNFLRSREKENGASDGSRTHNLLHGKQMLYQLSYTRGKLDSMGNRPLGKRILAFKIVNHHALATGLEDFFHKFHVQGMRLVGVLRGSVFKNKVQCDLIRLINHITMAAGHLATMIMQHAGAGLEVFFGSGKELLGGVGDIGLGPENYYM